MGSLARHLFGILVGMTALQSREQWADIDAANKESREARMRALDAIAQAGLREPGKLQDGEQDGEQQAGNEYRHL